MRKSNNVRHVDSSVCYAGRIVYFMGYGSGDPSKRLPGFSTCSLAYTGLVAALAYVGIRAVTVA